MSEVYINQLHKDDLPWIIEYDESKWARAAAACRDIIECDGGYELYHAPFNTVATLDRDATITGMKRSGKIREALTKAKARDAAVVEKLLDASKIGEDDNGNLTGLDDQVKALKASSAYLFEEEKGGRAGFGGGKDPSAGGGNGGNNAGNGEINALIRAAAGRTAE